MTELFLIAHRVRGEPAFDIAERMECPECNGHGDRDVVDGHTIPCTECDSLGYWWIVGTSGHRAYPYWSIELMSLGEDQSWPGEPGFQSVSSMISEHEMPEGLQDHYHHTASPATVRARLEDLLSALPPTPTTPFKRRF